MGKRGLKRKAPSLAVDDLELTLSDLDEDRSPAHFIVDKLSADRRHITRDEHTIQVDNGKDKRPEQSVSDHEYFIPEFIDLDAEEFQPEKKSFGDQPSRKRRYISSDLPLKNWYPLRDEYLDEMLRWEGRGEHTSLECPGCTGGLAEYRCRDCFQAQLYCKACTLTSHVVLPFHRVQRWNGKCFQKGSLKELGMRIQLGHHSQDRCANPIPARAKMVVVHTNGIHPTAIYYCGCDQAGAAGNQRQQLLRYRLYPATEQEPMTCATFDALETVHMENVQSKTGIYDLYMALERLMDNSGLRPVRGCYKALFRMICEWRHLKMLKRAGRGHDPTGAAGTMTGELAVECPACPLPGVNLPEGWNAVDDEERFLYTKFISLDACFRLKRYAVSDEQKDPIIDDGQAYFVPNGPYLEMVKKYKGQAPMSTCTGLAALDHADTKFSNGYAATGVGACIDGRHEFMLANGVGDLQKGERFINMDLINLHSRQHARGLRILTMYDIICQFIIHAMERMEEYPEELRMKLADYKKELLYAIGKLHWHGHKPEGHSRFSLNYIPGAARTDGEGIERRWWDIQPLASSTRMMGPGGRQGALNDVWGFSNWVKLIGLGPSLCKKYLVACKQAQEQAEEFEGLTESLDLGTRTEWEQLVIAWEKDFHDSPDPYVKPHDEVTEAEVRRQLAAEEEESIRTGKKTSLHEVSPASLLVIGLELEEQQRVLRHDAARERSSSTAKIFESRTALSRRIARYREIQALYMPIVPQLLAALPQRSTSSKIGVELAENSPLMLPSEVLKMERDDGPTAANEDPGRSARREKIISEFASGLVDAKTRLRQAQCHSAIDDLRTKGNMRTCFRTYKRINVCHQGPNTKANEALANIERRIQRAVSKYRAAREALRSLVATHALWMSDYDHVFLELKDADIRSLEADDPEMARKKKKMKKGKKVAEGSRVVSWIWRGADADDEFNAGVRVEWLKARARSLRWYEELRLLPEEVRRTVKAHLFKSDWWLSRGTMRTTVTPALQEGLSAYAVRQADIRRGLARQVGALWLKTAKAAIASLEDNPASDHDVVSATIRNSIAAVPSLHHVRPVSTTLGVDAFDADANADAMPVLGDDDNDNDDDADAGSDDEGVQELEESEAVIAFMELDTDTLQ